MTAVFSEKPHGFAVNKPDRFCVGDFGQTGHGDDVPQIGDNKAAAAFYFNVPYIDMKTGRDIQKFRVIGKRVLGLGNTDRIMGIFFRKGGNFFAAAAENTAPSAP